MHTNAHATKLAPKQFPPNQTKSESLHSFTAAYKVVEATKLSVVCNLEIATLRSHNMQLLCNFEILQHLHLTTSN